jgi:membrane fusion protein (multidrug efflux system)
VQQAAAAVQAAKINLDYTRVTAPISGRIGKSTVTPGALVTASQATALTTIQRLDRVYVDISQSSAEMLALRRSIADGQVGPGGPSVRLKLEDGSDYGLPGQLQFADVTVDQNTGTVNLRAIFPNPRDVLLPGMYVRAVITEGVQTNAILAPQIGVTRDVRGLPTAFVVDPQGKAQLRDLNTGRAVGDKWQVLSGLKAGDRLIVEGLQKVHADAPVRAVPAGSPPQAPPGGPAQGRK